MARVMTLLQILLIIALSSAPLAGAAPAEDFASYLEQSKSAMALGSWDRAIRLLTKVINIEPKFFAAYHNRAIAYSKKGEYDKSIKDLKKAVELNPNYPDSYGLLGLVYEIKKDYKRARQAYQMALAKETRPKVKETVKKWLSDLDGKMGKK